MIGAPVDHELNLVMQSILTYASWSIAAIMLAMAIAKDKRDKSPFYSLLVLAGLVGAYAEPLYDVGMMLWFYTPGIWSHFTAFDIPQPNWTHSGYVILYSGTAMLLCERLRNGLGRDGLFRWFAIALAMSMAFEIIAIQGGAYEYWGPHAFRILEYPLVIGILEATQVIFYALIANLLREKAKSKRVLLSLFIIFPCTFFMVNFGMGSPMIIALHWPTSNPLLVQAATLISIGAALYSVWAVSTILPGKQASSSSQPAIA
ncbi:MAG: hypothetical protein CL693_20315 [Cellvibrionaceae bacterium]|nr:hypothetical protein [Cellvibrionaceae bacterium]|tara:strand:- start:26898 stop:27677 length:780 start_codon:yes stop_codon:yes gene_type:complete